MYWAQALAEQNENAELKSEFQPIAEALSNGEEEIIKELNDAQGKHNDLKGYYKPDDAVVSDLMRPSSSLNAIIK